MAELRPIPNLDRFSTAIRQHLPWRTYYYVNWLDGKPKVPEAYPRKDRIPERVAPLGFILAFGLQGDTPYTRQAEIDYICETQHNPKCPERQNAWMPSNEGGCGCQALDLAPEWQEMRENGLPSFSLDQMHDEQDEQDEIAGNITYDQASTAPYNFPSRAEQALAEWEKSSWLAGPIVKAHWDITDKGNVTLVLDSVKHQAGPFITHKFTPEQKVELVRELLNSAIADGTVPTADELLEREYELDQAIRTGIRAPRRVKPSVESQWDTDDPYRFLLHQNDPQMHTRRPPRDSDSPWLIGHEDIDDEYGNQTIVVIDDTPDGVELVMREAPDELGVLPRPLNPRDFRFSNGPDRKRREWEDERKDKRKRRHRPKSLRLLQQNGDAPQP